MSVLEVVTFPTSSLNQESEPVNKVTDEVRELVKNMFETMTASNGIGLAAPQVGENITLFVMDVPKEDPIDPEKFISQPYCFINPKIVSEEGLVESEEGCLSCPDLNVVVERAEKVVVKGLDENGKEVSVEFDGLESICAQHEYDHLQGVLLTDHISRLKRDMYRKQMIRRKKEE